MEAVILVPVLMVVLLLAVQCALWAHAAQVVQLAAAEGDRIARADGGSAVAATSTARGVVTAGNSSVTSASVVVDPLPGEEVAVTVDGRAVSVLPWVRLPVHATVAGPVQTYRVSG